MLSNRNFILLWLMVAFSTLAVELFYVGVLVTIFQQTDSTLLAALTMAARTLPAFVLGPLAGVLVDRFPRKHFIMGMDAIRMLLVLTTVFILDEQGNLSIVGIYVILIALSAADVFHRPARMSIIPLLVTKDQLVKANSMIRLSTQITLATAYVIGGWLILVLELYQIGIGIIAIFILAIVLVMPISVSRRPIKNENKRESVWRSFTSGLRYMWQHPVARPLTIMETIENLPNGIWTGALILAFTLDGLGGTTADWGLQTSAYFIGMVIGSAIALGLTQQLGRYPGWIIFGNALLAGVLTLLYAFSPTVLFAVIITLIFGPPFALRDVAQDSLLQATVDNNHLGRVYATRQMLSRMVFTFAGVFFAALSEVFSIRIIYLVGGGIYLLTAAYALSNKSLRESHMKADPESIV